MKIIINADDLGYSERENNAIFSYLDENKITSSTIIANGPGFDRAVPGILLRNKERNISFGAHLNLTEFCPIINADIFQEVGFFHPAYLNQYPL
jgi:predicted glycoside hydrolase/deacetylase ChbG (UPF0249 family)